MIGTIFEFAGEIVEVRINDTNCLFRTKQFGGALAPIDSIKLDKEGSIKEHPDLKDREDWREETIKRFKKKIKSYDNEKQRMKYIIEDLKKYGYKPMYIAIDGMRPKKIK